MKWNKPTSLGKTVEARASNRPVKIAYLVPFDETSQTHLNLDAVYFESYTRWGGAYTLVIPTKADNFLLDDYGEWLKHYDPDFVYSFVDLDNTFIEKINHLCCPIAFRKHKISERIDREIDWRTFLPSWDHYIQPISSMSTVSSPSSNHHFSRKDRLQEPTIFTQYKTEPADRFLADNFGIGFDLYNVTHEIPGLFKTLCLSPSDLPANVIAGSKLCFTRIEALQAISDRNAKPISDLAMLNSESIQRIDSSEWASAFRLFIGSTPMDRINFWNCRQLGNQWSGTSNALILDPSFFDDLELVKQLGQYLNNHNFLSAGNGQYQTELHSCSLSVEVLNSLRDRLKPHTFNAVHVCQKPNDPTIPSKKDISDRIYFKSTDTSTIKLTDDCNEVTAIEPAHFDYIPAQFRGIARGQWVVELSIERHNNLSKFSNVIDTWILPRSHKVTHAFTDQPAKPTNGGKLALIPSINGAHSRINAIKDPCIYKLNLPTDEAFFRFLTLDFSQYPVDDLRALIPRTGYKDLTISDKGQNLRGVISMFNDLPTAFQILTNKYWRSVLEEVKEDKTNPLTFDRNKLFSLIPNDTATLNHLTQQLHFENKSVTSKYLKDSLIDTLEHLVRSNVFYQVAKWRCKYCGHSNSRSFDSMKIKNTCDICESEYFAPIDIEWQFELNDFVYRSIQKHSGMPVLWTLGFLQDRLHSGSFWYLPEVDMYEQDDDLVCKNEIDILAILNGTFYAVEAKRTVSMFLNKVGSVDKFVKMMSLLRPDVALLAFESYCPDEKNTQEIKDKLADTAKQIRDSIGPWTRLEILVAQEEQYFQDFPTDLGWHSHRVSKYFIT